MNSLYQIYICCIYLLLSNVLFAQTADLELHLQSAPDSYSPNEEIIFIVQLLNKGNETTDAEVAFQLPDSTSLLGVFSSNGSYLPHIGRWRVYNLAPDDTTSLRIRAYNFKHEGTMNAFAQIAYASVADPDSSPNNNRSIIPNEDDEAALQIYRLGQHPTQINLLDFPKDKQLYPRDIQTNIGIIPVKGTATDGQTYTGIRAKMYRNEELQQIFFTNLDYVEGVADFEFTIPIVAELANYRLELFGLKANELEVPIQSATDLVAGDVYIINGQSNAQANVAPFPSDNHPFTRSHSVERGWTSLQFSSPGQWGARMAFHIVKEQGIPVAVFNEAVGGKRIDFYLKNEQNPDSDNYGKLFNRLEAAGVREQVRAGFWFQGEADGWVADESFMNTYKQKFKKIHTAWLQDYAIEQCYIFQIRHQSCLHLYPYVMEAQRSLQYDLPNVSTMSTTNTAHDSCHYYYEGGYSALGDRVYGLVARDMYAASDYNVAAPDIRRAYLSGSQEITIELRDIQGEIQIQGNPWSEFIIEGSEAKVVDGQVIDGRIILELSSEPGGATGVSYYAHVGEAPDWLVNDRGVGMLTFYNYAIEDLPAFSADLEVLLHTSYTHYEQFRIFDYEIEVSNRSDIAATNIVIEVPLPAGTAFSRSEFSAGQYLSWENEWHIPSLAADSSVRLKIYVFPLVSDAVIVAYAQVADVDQSDPDSKPANGTRTFPREDDEARLLFNPIQDEIAETDIALFLESDASEYSIYNNVTYYLTVENRGLADATNLQIDISLSEAFAYTQHLQTHGNYDNWNSHWYIEELKAGEKAELQLVLFTLAENALLAVSADLLSLDQRDVNLSNNQTNWTIAPNQNVSYDTPFSSERKVEKDAIKIYPIPVHDILTLKTFSENTYQSKLYLTDLQGRTVKELHYNFSEGTNTLSIDLSELGSGIYFLKIQAIDNKILSYKVVKQ